MTCNVISPIIEYLIIFDTLCIHLLVDLDYLLFIEIKVR